MAHTKRGKAAHYVGQAGENLVAAHLLRRGYNAARLQVDSGVDVVAHSRQQSGASHLVQIQVKTTATRTCDFTLSTSVVNHYWRDCVNLVVVFWQDPAPMRVVLSPTTLFQFSSGDPSNRDAPLRPKKGKVRFVVKLTNTGKVYLRNRRWDLSRFVGAFRLLEAVSHNAAPQA